MTYCKDLVHVTIDYSEEKPTTSLSELSSHPSKGLWIFFQVLSYFNRQFPSALSGDKICRLYFLYSTVIRMDEEGGGGGDEDVVAAM